MTYEATITRHRLQICWVFLKQRHTLLNQLTDTVESLWHNVRDDGYAFDKLYFVVAPRGDDTVTTYKER